MTITIKLCVTANTETTASTDYNTHERVGLARITGARGYDYVEVVLWKGTGKGHMSTYSSTSLANCYFSDSSN